MQYWWNRIRAWLKTPVPRRATLYTRAGCHLCDVAQTVLETHGYQVELVDIDASDELTSQFGLEIPVVLINGVVRFRGRVDPVLLKRLK